MLKTVIFSSSVMLLAMAATVQAESPSPVERLTLQTDALRVEVTPDIGGRVLHISRPGKPNILRIGKAVEEMPNPHVSSTSGNIGYFGHEMWVGPQSAWWTQQTVNAERLAAKSVWPPDPFLVLSRHTIKQQNDAQILLQGPDSPISGIAFTKHYQLVKEQPGSLRLDVTARNIQSALVSWDIWFNTRVRAEAHVYVPVKDKKQVRLNPFPGKDVAPPVYQLNHGFFSFELVAPPEGKSVRRGKVFMQPAAGWIAAFDQGQVFIIQFPLQPADVIHPEQGQVELYLDYQPDNPEGNVMELEVHAPYKTLQPGEVMHAHEVWTVLPYEGDFTNEAHIEFLKKNAGELGLDRS